MTILHRHRKSMVWIWMYLPCKTRAKLFLIILLLYIERWRRMIRRWEDRFYFMIQALGSRRFNQLFRISMDDSWIFQECYCTSIVTTRWIFFYTYKPNVLLISDRILCTDSIHLSLISLDSLHFTSLSPVLNLFHITPHRNQHPRKNSRQGSHIHKDD